MLKFLSKSKKSSRVISHSPFNFFHKNISSFSIIAIPRNSSIPYTYKVNDIIHDFKITKIEDIQDFSIKAFTLEHEKTKARYVHFHAPDKNNTFSIIFRTIPSDNKGAPHILEHLVLCGSEKYPVRDPFMIMLKRSLNIHMNTLTGSDYTSYPFSTYNEKDFYNLLSVYTDAVFKPTLNYYDFLQQAWRYDFQLENNERSLVYRGFLFNQMKGIYQTSDNLFEEYIQKNLFQNSPYRFSAGGHHRELVKLDYQELKGYYQKYYNPSNAVFFSYGDLDFTKTLKYLNETYLNKYQYNETRNEVQSQPKYDHVIEVKVKGPPDITNLDPSKQAKFSLSFLCNDVIKDPLIAIALNILSYLFFETPNSPFYKALLESGLAEGYCPGYGYDMSTKESTFTIGVKGVDSDYGKLMQIEQVINNTLHEIVNTGFNNEFIEGILHQIEVQAKLPRNDFGINVMQSILVLLNHNGDSTFMLKVNENLSNLRRRIKKGKFFENLVKEYLIDNQHKLRLIMTPDSDYIVDDLEYEKKTLKLIEKSLTEEQKIKINHDNEGLKERQEELIDPNILPILEIQDIPKQGDKTIFQHTKIMDIPVSYTEQPTNGLTFLRIKFNIKNVPAHMRPFIRIFCEFLPKLGTRTLKHEKMSEVLDLYTFNFEVTHQSFSLPINTNESEEYIVLQIGCLDRNIENMFNLIMDLFLHADYKDYANLSQLVKIHSSEAANGFVENSLEYAINYAGSGYRNSIYLSNKVDSSRFLCNFGADFLKSLSIKEYLEELSFNLSKINEYIFKKDVISFAIHSNKDMFEQVQRRIEIMLYTFKSEKPNFLIDSAKNNLNQVKAYTFKPIYYKSHFALPMQTNYAIESIPIPHYTHPDTPKLHLLSELMTSGILEEEIRDRGGAYGGGSNINSTCGAFNFYSYRDPHVLQSYEAFEKAVQWAKHGEMTGQHIKDAKISLFSKIDKVIEPQNRGLRYWLQGIDDDMKDEYRKKLLETSKDDLVQVADKYLLEKIKNGETSQVIFGSQNNDLETLMSRGWKIERPVEGLSVQEDSYEQNKKPHPALPYE